jgi:FixJ family two-component response regulator
MSRVGFEDAVREPVVAHEPPDVFLRIEFRKLVFGCARGQARLEDKRSVAGLRARIETLTAREREVMAGVVAGRLNKQIAGDLGISEITVKVHRGQVMRKMKASSAPDLARMADKLEAAHEGE